MRLARALVAIGALGLGGGAVACSAILGLEERTLRQDAGLDAALPDADAASCEDAGFCACSKHDFCDDFDSYNAVSGISKRWTNALGYPPSVLIQGGATFDASGPAVSPPNALQVRTDIVLGKAAAAAFFVQIDGRPLHSKPIVGVKVGLQLRVDAIDPADGSEPLADSGARELVTVMALVSGSSSDGVGLLLSDLGGYVGYAVNVNNLLNATVAQGLTFSENKLATTPAYFFPYTVIVAPRNSVEVAGVTCSAGPVMTNGDGGPDADGGPNPLVVVVVPPFVVGTKVCEVLGGALLDPSWVQNPALAIGGVQTGVGSFQAAFDNITIDFLTE
ncbi:MAG TPA: hypothetical protein VF316_12145 [Polyangiaceae bacterium]